MKYCRICCSKLGPPLISISKPSLTSNLVKKEINTDIYVCKDCTHAQSPDLPNIDNYYDTEYKISLSTEEFDQLFRVKNGKNIYRTDFQASLILKQNIKKGARILDFGCGKATTLKKIFFSRPDIKPYAFEVSDDYSIFWDKWIPETNQATHSIPSKWTYKFDLIISNFVLEHVKNPVEILCVLKKLLKPSGMLVFTVPNSLQNSGDYFVVDHINKFTFSSISKAIKIAGFDNYKILEDIFKGAFFVVVSNKEYKKKYSELDPSKKSNDLKSVYNQLHAWDSRIKKIKNFNTKRSEFIIYGAGFYGSLYSIFLKEKPIFFLDNSKFLINEKRFRIPIIKPENCPKKVKLLIVGLSPEKKQDLSITNSKWLPKNCKIIYF